MSALHVEYDDDGYDPGGFSFVDRTVSIWNYDEETQKTFGEPEGSVVFVAVYRDDELTKEDVFHDEVVEGELVEAVDDYMDPQERRYRRARRCGIFCCGFILCIFLVLGLCIAIISAYFNIHANNAAKYNTPAVPTNSPTAAPVMTRPPSLGDVQQVSLPEVVALHPSCFVCSDGTQDQEEGIFSMTKPNELVFVPPNTMMDSKTDMTCEYLYIAGTTGLIDPESCSYLQSKTSVKKRCGCISTLGQRADSLFVEKAEIVFNPEPIFPSCYVCGSKVLGKPLGIITLQSYEDPQTCQDVDALGITGHMSARMCTNIQSDDEIIEECGCGFTGEEEGEGKGDNVSTTTIALTEVGEFPPCFLCGSEEDTFSNPDHVLSLPGALGNPEELTCADMNNIGKKGNIAPEGCDMLQSMTDNLEQCGCSNVVSADGPRDPTEPFVYERSPAMKEISLAINPSTKESISDEEEIHSVYTPCYLCGSETNTFSAPDFVPSLSKFLGYPEGTTCAELDRIRKEDNITPKECAIIQSEILEQCGCSSGISV
jgi:hypothetical protein